MRVYTTIEQAQQLPCYHRQTIPKDYLDVMGHMNVRYYMALFDEGGWGFFRALGMDEAYYRDNNAGGFALRQYITYVAEAR
ncbi:MAG: thioesterase family protein, partial [Chloroflexota bacterium]